MHFFLCQIKPHELEAPHFLYLLSGELALRSKECLLWARQFSYIFSSNLCAGCLLSPPPHPDLFSTPLHPLCTPDAELRQPQPALSSSGFPWVWPMRSISRRWHTEKRAPKVCVPWFPLQNLYWLAASCHQWSHPHKVALHTASLSPGFVL